MRMTRTENDDDDKNLIFPWSAIIAQRNCVTEHLYKSSQKIIEFN